MRLMEKNRLAEEMLPGRIITKAVGKDAPCASARMTVGYADYRREAGPMAPHNHAEETVFVIRSDKAFVRFGETQNALCERVALRAGMLLHFDPLEWHVFEYDEDGCLEILFIYGQVDHIRPEEQ